MYTLFIIVYVIVCLFLVLVVLLQQGKGSDVASAFGGGGSSQTAFGPRGSSTLLHKLTTASFVLFVALSIGLSAMTARRTRSLTAGVMGPDPVTTPVAQETPEVEEAPVAVETPEDEDTASPPPVTE